MVFYKGSFQFGECFFDRDEGARQRSQCVAHRFKSLISTLDNNVGFYIHWAIKNIAFVHV